MKKPCSKCLRALDLSKFCVDKRAKDGHSSWCKECHCLANILAQEKVKLAILERYGGAFCAKCGIADVDVLTLDHTEQNGAAHKAQDITAKQDMYRWVRRHKFPKGFRVLCYNCNIKAFREFQKANRAAKYALISKEINHGNTKEKSTCSKHKHC